MKHIVRHTVSLSRSQIAAIIIAQLNLPAGTIARPIFSERSDQFDRGPGITELSSIEFTYTTEL